ncbi:unnamed protein product, partial [Rotaria socialis]
MKNKFIIKVPYHYIASALQNRQRSSSTKNVIGVSPEPYLDLISNPFDKRQWNYLSFGPSYIRVNQSAIRPKCQQETEIKNQHKDIYSKVENNLTGYPHLIPRNNTIFKQYSDHLLDYLNQSYFTPLSYKDQLISHEQAQILGSIRRIIQNRNLILFPDTNAFIESSCNPFNEILDKVIQLLNTLRGKDLIRKWQYEQMMPDRTTYKILRPIFDAKSNDTTIIDGASLITELSKYNKKGLLKSTTLFCTFDIRNLYTILPQEETLDTLMAFLHAHGYRKVKGISIDTIKRLASIILQDNVFAYGKKIYKQTTGGAMGSSLTLTLANIFMSNWQKNIVEEQTKTGEFYGRYIDDIFMTWNRSEEELRKLLDDVNTWHPNIKLDYKISNSLPFLDVQLTNNNGILSTCVYHKPSAEPYVTPFISDHPRHVFSNIIKNFIERATRYSSTFEAFNCERRYIKLMLLYNGYPSTFIENEFHKYFSEYISKSPFLPLIDDEQKYFLMRKQILGQPTPRQTQVALSAALADIDNDPLDDDERQQPNPDPKKSEENISNINEKFFTHFTYEKRFKTWKRDMHQVYQDTFKDTPAMYKKLMVGNRIRRQTHNELIRKRPKKPLLQNKTIIKSSQTCSYMWDPVFELSSSNQPMCPVPTDAVIFYSTVRKGGYWTLNSGSTQGGTMIWIHGNRFAQNGFNSVPSIINTNTVQLVDGYSVYDCEMHNDKITNTQLTCYAPILSEGYYQIRVYVNGYLIPLYQYYDSRQASFTPMLSHTPIITSITPQSGTPQSLIELAGSFKTACYSRDVDGCAQDNNPLISRIYVGGHLCNVIDPISGATYTTANDTALICFFEDNEVGLFNITMLVTNEYGRSLARSNLYRISADENLYMFQSYAVISSVTPNTGSTQGGTMLNINGNYFSTSTRYPLVVKVGNQPCTILSSTTTTIQCQTPVAPSSSQNQYQGGRGLQMYSTSGYTTQSTLSSSNPPTQTGTPTRTDDALYVSNSSSAETVWLIGFVRVPKTATFTFILDTNGAAALFLSTNDDPTNKVLIASATNNHSPDILLNNNTNYYIFCVGSRSNGYLRLGIQARMHETTLTATTSSLVFNEIQRIAIATIVTPEQQQITYTVSPTNGTSEVQSLQVDNSIFQIGFRGVYTGRV